ncbi:hypothetical protein LLY42_24900 [Pseudomonas frederiksbergensis]|nr:hypothetical protein LLY42_24900 [Pseudomonas frederiksbergensis]
MGVMQRKMPFDSVPFLARNAVLRTGEDKLPGYYSSETDMWVIDTEQGPTPIISKGALSELATKTKVNAEQDDECSFVFLESVTKTAVKVERDDDPRFEMSHLLELVTKTDTVTERDDAASEANYLLELTTKTSAELEKDDNGDPTFGLHTQYFKD